ncbi:ribonuclease H-like domain-containing protein [Crucibulum laeve]|uniref:ribonuclease H n=1 Tax=Crucibulum laeve TaxID=68775 RepID=A0A5C3MBI4_9AGAR|nr:ribonuclease H-like domain-containing protein [Crucibulum laeve]
MVKGNAASFYAVKVGRQTGIFRTWDDCQAQIKGYPNAKYKKFPNAAEAEQFLVGTATTSALATSSSSAEATTNAKGKKRAYDEDVDETGWDVVYSDGACKGNGKVGSMAGIGVWWGPSDARNIAERCPGDQTNNRAELIAIVRVLETTPHSKKKLLIKTDSKYSRDCVGGWLRKWTSNGFLNTQGEPVKNAAVIRYLSALLDARALNGQIIRIQYVKGHAGIVGNEGADDEANKGARLPPVPERDWETLEKNLREQEAKLDRDVEPAPLQVQDLEAGEEVESIELPTKIRRIHLPPTESLKSSTPSNDANSAIPGTPSHSTTTAQSLSVPTRSYHSTVPSSSLTPSTSLIKPLSVIQASKIPLSAPMLLAPSSPVSPAKPLAQYATASIQTTLPKALEAAGQRVRGEEIGPITRLKRTANCPLKVLAAVPLLIEVSIEDVNVDDYADCILDNDDLASELND